MAVVFTENQYYQDIADAIRSKNGSSDTYLPSEMAAAIEDISGGGSSGGGGSSSDPVKFIDYDGTILHSYSIADFMALTAMPDNPSHSGLTAQGWNWSLADAKAQLTAMPEAGLTIGQMYITDDGKTRIYVHFEEARKSPYFGICPKGTVTVDWGDGSATDTLTGTSLTTVKTVQHKFPSAGDYMITLTVESGEFAFYGTNTGSYLLRTFISASGSADKNRVYANSVRKVEFGIGAIPKTYAFYNCASLETVTIPVATNIGDSHIFNGCHSLKSFSIPNGNDIANNYMFQYCYSLLFISIPSSLKHFADSTFRECTSLRSITLPNGFESVGTYALYLCYSLETIVIPSSFTTLNTSMFYGCYSLKKIIVKNANTIIKSSSFQACRSLISFAISDVQTSIEGSTFRACYSLSSLTIPSGVESIGTYAFQNCYGIKEYHFLSTTPPTLANTNAFQYVSSDCIIYVPQGSLEAYQTSTNWSSYSSYMQEEPAS